MEGCKVNTFTRGDRVLLRSIEGCGTSRDGQDATILSCPCLHWYKLLFDDDHESDYPFPMITLLTTSTMTLQNHNTAQFQLIELMRRNELHLLKEFIQDLDPNDPDVKAAIEDRVADIISQGEGARMAEIVD